MNNSIFEAFSVPFEFKLTFYKIEDNIYLGSLLTDFG